MQLKFSYGGNYATSVYYWKFRFRKVLHSFQSVIQEAREHPEQLFYVIVPEQFTMQTQKTLVEMHPDGGILNIDVLSFERLAFRVFEEVGGDTRKILEETGKNMVLRSWSRSIRKIWFI